MNTALQLLALPVVAVIVAIITVLTTGIAASWLRRARVLDKPNERSSHLQATPRGGGLALIPVILGIWFLLPPILGKPLPPALPVIGGAVIFLMIISFVDDLRGLSPLPRLAAQVLAVAAGLWVLPSDTLLLQGLAPLWLDRVIAALAWLWCINLFNFMDGIDGISGVETASIGSGLALLSALAFLPLPLGVGALLVAAAALGFLAWNWHPARIFLGDVGSISLGYLLGFLLLAAAGQGAWAAALILPLFYVADATWTLIARLRRGEKIWQAHRQHFYQRAAGMRGHARVATGVALCNALLVLLAILSQTWIAWAALLLAGLVVGLFLFWLQSLALSAEEA